MPLIRQATDADLPAIHGLVAELAAYVDCLDRFTATLATYEKDFAAGVFEALVAEYDDGQVIGMALYFDVYSTWKGRMIYLEDFVISPKYRRQGIGQQLWDRLKEIGRGRGCWALKWQVAGHNKEAMKFYGAQEAWMDESWIDGKLVL